jgi:hypothetical protein
MGILLSVLSFRVATHRVILMKRFWITLEMLFTFMYKTGLKMAKISLKPNQ